MISWQVYYTLSLIILSCYLCSAPGDVSILSTNPQYSTTATDDGIFVKYSCYGHQSGDDLDT